MKSAKEIRSRIKSIRDTRKITNAMYLISSTKIKKAKKALEDTRPYFYALRREIKRIFRTIKDIESDFLYPVNRNEFVEGAYGYLIITADKGLAGAYNSNVIQLAMEEFNKSELHKLYVVGEYGRHYFTRHGIEIEQDFTYSAQQPTMEEASYIAKELLDEYLEGNIKKIFIVYTDFQDIGIKDPKITRLLPFHRDYLPNQLEQKEEESFKHNIEFATDVKKILEDLAINYVIGFIYGALVDSYCSELDFRMNAMQSANQNADNILDDLTLQYNRVRQSAITQEITEVSAGAKGMKEKRKRKKANDETNR